MRKFVFIINVNQRKRFHSSNVSLLSLCLISHWSTTIYSKLPNSLYSWRISQCKRLHIKPAWENWSLWVISALHSANLKSYEVKNSLRSTPLFQKLYWTKMVRLLEKILSVYLKSFEDSLLNQLTSILLNIWKNCTVYKLNDEEFSKSILIIFISNW